MPAPEGAQFMLLSNDSIEIIGETSFSIPKLSVGEPFTIPQTFHGKIFQVPSPQGSGHYFGSAMITSQISLCGRVFPSSIVVTEIPVQYPVKIQSIQCQQQVLI